MITSFTRDLVGDELRLLRLLGNLLNHVNRRKGDVHDWGNVPCLGECVELNNHRYVQHDDGDDETRIWPDSGLSLHRARASSLSQQLDRVTNGQNLRRVTLENNRESVELTFFPWAVTLASRDIALDPLPRISNERILVPVRFVSL